MHGGDLHLWFVFAELVREPSLLETYRRLLTPEERAQEVRFRHPRDQHRYLLTRALVRTTLSRYVDLPPENWRFVADEFGRPHIANDAAQARDLSFNIAHTRDTIVLGITRGRALGVDVEGCAGTAPLEVARRYFSAREADALYALPGDAQHRRFFEYWTLKEAYIKARGKGLSIPLDEFGFDIDESAMLGFWAQPTLDPTPQMWRFWQFTVGEAQLVAMCAQDTSSSTEISSARVVVPGISDESVPLTMTRRSG
jgi:4'-phosphopantetheinyl transferase